MPPVGTNWNPAQVMMGRPSSGSGPYLWSGPGKSPLPPGGGSVGLNPTPQSSGKPNNSVGITAKPYSSDLNTTPVAAGNVLGPRTVRTTGSGPFDAAYRQNLASYAGGQFGGNLSFNPTDPSSFPGNPTGGGTAPVAGMPTSLMDMALAGQGFSWTPPAPAQTATKPPQYNDMQQWMDQFMRNGRGQRMGSIL